MGSVCGLKQEFDIAAQVIDAGRCERRVTLGFGQNERALQNSLCVKGEALGSPVATDAVTFDRFLDVRYDRRRVAADTGLARLTNLGAALVDFLHHRADEAGELRNLAREHGLAKIDVAKNAVERVRAPVIGRGGK